MNDFAAYIAFDYVFDFDLIFCLNGFADWKERGP